MRYFIGVDMGATQVKLGLLDSNCRIVKRKRLDTAAFTGKDSLIGAIAQSIILLASGIKYKIKGIGVGAPGLVNPEKGLIHYLVNIPGWENVHLKRILESRVGLPVFIDNDVNVMALAELYHGRAKGKRNVVCLALGTGVGGGLILEGRLYRGAAFSAGELGHIPLNEEGPSCNCGGRACLERYVGNRYIIEQALDKLKKAPLPTRIPELVKNDLSKINPQILSIAASRGDLLAKEIWQTVGRHIGVCLTGVVNLLNPELVVIGGGVAEAGEILFDTIRKTVNERAMSVPAQSVKIVPAKLKENAGLIGAAVLAREEIKRSG